MGNYYSGTLSFVFKPDQPEILNNIIDYIKYEYKCKESDQDNFDYNKYYNNILEYINSNKNIFTQGLDLYKNGYGEIRSISMCFIFRYKPNCNSYDNEAYDFISLLDYITEKEEFEKKTYPDIPKNIDDVNFESLTKAFCPVWNKIYKEDSKIQLCIDIRVNDKGYCDDEGLTELINLWSPYLDETFDKGYIGTIEDEDGTFRKDYYVNNIPHDNHWEFCGSWCDYYKNTVRCKDMKCRNAYDLGKRSKENHCAICDNKFDKLLNIIHYKDRDKYVCDDCFFYYRDSASYTYQIRKAAMIIEEDEIGEIYSFDSKEELKSFIESNKPEDCDIYLDQAILLEYEDGRDAIDSICYVKHGKVYPLVVAFIPRRSGIDLNDYPSWKALYELNSPVEINLT